MTAALYVALLHTMPLAGELAIPSAGHRAAIVLRALAYRRAAQPTTGELTLAIIDAPGAASSDGVEMAKALAALAERVQVSGRRVRTLRIRFSGNVNEALAREHVEVVYIPTGVTSRSALWAALAAPGRLLVCADPAAVGEGCHLSVESEGTGSRLVVDAAAAQRADVRFDARLLRLARHVGPT